MKSIATLVPILMTAIASSSYLLAPGRCTVLLAPFLRHYPQEIESIKPFASSGILAVIRQELLEGRFPELFVESLCQPMLNPSFFLATDLQTMRITLSESASDENVSLSPIPRQRIVNRVGNTLK
ncbi:MAG: hypothetical protein ACLQQ0_04870 [Limisphaerales bacterium]